jgi:hypothetical protein
MFKTSGRLRKFVRVFDAKVATVGSWGSGLETGSAARVGNQPLARANKTQPEKCEAGCASAHTRPSAAPFSSGIKVHQ